MEVIDANVATVASVVFADELEEEQSCDNSKSIIDSARSETTTVRESTYYDGFRDDSTNPANTSMDKSFNTSTFDRLVGSMYLRGNTPRQINTAGLEGTLQDLFLEFLTSKEKRDKEKDYWSFSHFIIFLRHIKLLNEKCDHEDAVDIWSRVTETDVDVDQFPLLLDYLREHLEYGSLLDFYHDIQLRRDGDFDYDHLDAHFFRLSEVIFRSSSICAIYLYADVLRELYNFYSIPISNFNFFGSSQIIQEGVSARNFFRLLMSLGFVSNVVLYTDVIAVYRTLLCGHVGKQSVVLGKANFRRIMPKQYHEYQRWLEDEKNHKEFFIDPIACHGPVKEHTTGEPVTDFPFFIELIFGIITTSSPTLPKDCSMRDVEERINDVMHWADLPEVLPEGWTAKQYFRDLQDEEAEGKVSMQELLEQVLEQLPPKPQVQLTNPGVPEDELPPPPVTFEEFAMKRAMASASKKKKKKKTSSKKSKDGDSKGKNKNDKDAKGKKKGKKKGDKKKDLSTTRWGELQYYALNKPFQPPEIKKGWRTRECPHRLDHLDKIDRIEAGMETEDQEESSETENDEPLERLTVGDSHDVRVLCIVEPLEPPQQALEKLLRDAVRYEEENIEETTPRENFQKGNDIPPPPRRDAEEMIEMIEAAAIKRNTKQFEHACWLFLKCRLRWLGYTQKEEDEILKGISIDEMMDHIDNIRISDGIPDASDHSENPRKYRVIPLAAEIYFFLSLADIAEQLDYVEVALGALWRILKYVHHMAPKCTDEEGRNRFLKLGTMGGTVISQLGIYAFRKRWYPLAARSFLTVSLIREHFMGDSPVTAIAYSNLGCAYTQMDRGHEASAYMELSYAILQFTKGLDDSTTSICKRNWDLVRRQRMQSLLLKPHIYFIPFREVVVKPKKKKKAVAKKDGKKKKIKRHAQK